ncbi:MFS transporter, partial [Rhizobium johnstonii]
TEKGIWGWMFFDWAAQPFFTFVTTFIFGPYFVSRLTDDPVSAQTTLSNMATISSVIIALLSPVLGSIADQSCARKPEAGEAGDLD